MTKSTCRTLGILFVGVPAAVAAAVRVTGGDFGYRLENFLTLQFAVVLAVTLLIGGWGLGSLAGIALWRLLSGSESSTTAE